MNTGKYAGEMVSKMSRAQNRREEKEKEQKKKTFIMTAEELYKIRNQEYLKAKRQLEAQNKQTAETILRMMLIIPANVLIADYWQKSAKKRIPEFMKSCMDLYQAWQQGVVDIEQMQKLTEEYAGIDMSETISSKVMNELN